MSANRITAWSGLTVMPLFSYFHNNGNKALMSNGCAEEKGYGS
jgi:hypothetical protein